MTIDSAEVYPLIRAFLTEREISADVNSLTDLTKIGLTSIDMINLILHVEGHFGLSFHDEDVVISNFNTVESITELLLRYERFK